MVSESSEAIASSKDATGRICWPRKSARMEAVIFLLGCKFAAIVDVVMRFPQIIGICVFCDDPIFFG